MKKRYDILVKWEKDVRSLYPIDAIEKTTQYLREYSLRFEYLGKEYKYTWVSNQSTGISALYDSTGCLYDAYKKNPTPEAVSLHDAANQLSVLLRNEKSDCRKNTFTGVNIL